MADSVFCTNCGDPIKWEPPIPDEPSQRKPCPQCGSTARIVNVEARAQASAFGRATLTVTHYSETLLAKAQELITKGEFSLAVVVAHTACEISAESAISRAFAEKGIGYLVAPLSAFFNGSSLSNDRICNLYNAVTGNQIQAQSFFTAFKASAKHRNDVVHSGKIVTKAEADDSYKAASALVAYLK